MLLCRNCRFIDVNYSNVEASMCSAIKSPITGKPSQSCLVQRSELGACRSSAEMYLVNPALEK